MVSFPFEKKKELYKKTKGWNNGKSFVSSNVIIGKIIFLSHVPCPPLPTWMERDTVRVRSPDQEHNKMTPVRAQTRIGTLDLESSEVQRHPIL